MKEAQFNIILATLWLINANILFFAGYIKTGWFAMIASILFMIFALLSKLNDSGEEGVTR